MSAVPRSSVSQAGVPRAAHRSAVPRSSVPRSSVPQAAVPRAARRSNVPRATVGLAPHRGPAVRGITVPRATAGIAARAGRREAARLAQARTPLLTEPRAHLELVGSSQQLAVVVVLGPRPPVHPVGVGPLVHRTPWPVGAVFTRLAPSGQTVGIAAQTGVATFHQLPPGPIVQRAAGSLPLSAECRSRDIPCRT